MHPSWHGLGWERAGSGAADRPAPSKASRAADDAHCGVADLGGVGPVGHPEPSAGRRPPQMRRTMRAFRGRAWDGAPVLAELTPLAHERWTGTRTGATSLRSGAVLHRLVRHGTRNGEHLLFAYSVTRM